MGSYFEQYGKVAKSTAEADWIHFIYRKRWELFRGKWVLDIGCGPGYFVWTAPPEASAFGIDLDLASAQHGGKRCCVAAADCLPFRDEMFDGVHCAHVIEHSGAPERIVSEIRRVLRPEGTLLLFTPDIERYRFKFYDDHTHRTPFNRRGLQRLLEMYDFEVKAIERGLMHETRIELLLRRIFRPSYELIYRIRKAMGVRWNWELVCLAVKRG